MNSIRTCQLVFINDVNKVNVDFIVIFPIYLIKKLCGPINCKSYLNQDHFLKPKKCTILKINFILYY